MGRAKRDDVILDVKNLKMYFSLAEGLFQKGAAEVKAVDDVSFHIKRNETMGLVGESGCGKTTTGRCILRLYRPTGGEIVFEGKNIARISEYRIRPLRRRMQLIFQDPCSSLNPRRNAGSIVGELLIIHKLVRGKGEYRDRVESLFRMVGLDPDLAYRMPHEFSGGQRQRLGIARALSCDPSFIVCDEPISALDVSIQAQIMNLLEELQEKLGLTYLFIAHDLSVVRHISDRIGVMYLGHIVEIAGWEELYDNPLHPYTRALLSAVPIPDPFVEETRERIILEGDVPSPISPPRGCVFHPRCPRATAACREQTPRLLDAGGGHEVACIMV